SSNDNSDDSEFDASDLTDNSFQIIKLKTLSSWDEETQERAKAKLTR
ncbi:41154_t:CDS:2, partial [Gigaspora margarita]